MLFLLLLLSALAAICVWELRAIRKNMMTRNDMPHWFDEWIKKEDAREIEKALHQAAASSLRSKKS